MKILPPLFTIAWAIIGTFKPLQAEPRADHDLTNAGAEFVGLLAKENFTAAMRDFDPTMKGVMPEAKLREVWQALLKQAGKFEQQLQTRVEYAGSYKVVLVTCRFGTATLDVKVVYDGQGKVAGLFFLPSQAAAAEYKTPSYVDTKRIREEVFAVGSEPFRLPGTLTRPTFINTATPAVVLVHGSGPEDRDETIGANKPFRDLAGGLATQGIAVLRYEKRTKQFPALFGEEGRNHFTARDETIDDAVSAVAQLRNTLGIDPRRVFVLGHSLGGTLAPRIGQADPEIAGLIILAGSARPLEDIILEQIRYIISIGDESSSEAKTKLLEVQTTAHRVKKLTASDAASPDLLFGAPAAYWLDLRQNDSLAIAKQLRQRLLLLQGGRDYQVTLKDFDRWKVALSSRPGVTFMLYPELNHLFIAGDGKSVPDEYQRPGHVDEKLVTDIAAWITH